MDSVEIRGIGDAGNLRGHGLVLGVDDEPLVGVVGAGGRLLGQLLHADELLVHHGEGPVRGLDQGDGVVDVAHALVHAGDVRAHELADGQPGRVVRRGIDAQARGQALHRTRQGEECAAQVAGRVQGHEVVIDDQKTWDHPSRRGRRAPPPIRRPDRKHLLPVCISANPPQFFRELPVLTQFFRFGTLREKERAWTTPWKPTARAACARLPAPWKQNNFEVHLAADAAEAKALVLDTLIPALVKDYGAKSAAFGGSATLVSTGIYEAIKACPDLRVLDTYDTTRPSTSASSSAPVPAHRHLPHQLQRGHRRRQAGQPGQHRQPGGGHHLRAQARHRGGRPQQDRARPERGHVPHPGRGRPGQRPAPGAQDPCAKTMRCEDCSSPDRICNTWSSPRNPIPRAASRSSWSTRTWASNPRKRRHESRGHQRQRTQGREHRPDGALRVCGTGERKASKPSSTS